MSDIFLSYKSEDRPKAKIIAEALEKHGYSVWWDRIIPPGKTFDQVIEESLDAAKCVIVMWSRLSVSSDWVKNEAREGTRRQILVPILIDDVKIPFEFRHIQAAQLIDWKGNLPHPEFDLLLKSVTEIVGRSRMTKTELQKPSIDEPNISTQNLHEEGRFFKVIKEDTTIAMIWKWGSMIASLANVIFVGITIVANTAYEIQRLVHLIWFVFALPPIIYLMYKERSEKTKYEKKVKYAVIWIFLASVLYVLDALVSFNIENMIIGIFWIIPAFIIDVIYINRTRSN